MLHAWVFSLRPHENEALYNGGREIVENNNGSLLKKCFQDFFMHKAKVLKEGKLEKRFSFILNFYHGPFLALKGHFFAGKVEVPSSLCIGTAST